jgi:hypothetical protein
MISLLCRWFPALRVFWLAIGYVLLVIGGGVWFACFPLTAYSLYTAREFPFDYFGVPFQSGFPLEAFLPNDMVPLLIPVCLAFTLYGLFLIFFNVRNLRKLRRGEK